MRIDLDELFDGLSDHHDRISEVTREGLESGLAPLDICGIIADLHDELTERLLGRCLAVLGEPPSDWVWLALGSHGRREQVPSSDQDSAIAYSPHSEAAAYFSQLARFMVKGLTIAGLPECDGGYMATNWCKPLADYRSLFTSWVDNPQPQALLQAEVFLDVRGFGGTLDVDELQEVLIHGGTRGPFRAQMASAALTFTPPLSMFGRLKVTDESIDVKRGGTAAIVLLARLYGLMAGSRSFSTVERINDAVAGGTLHHQTGDDLIVAYQFLTGLRLKNQVRQLAPGLAPNNVVPMETLSKADRKKLLGHLKTINDIQKVTATRFATHTLS